MRSCLDTWAGVRIVQLFRWLMSGMDLLSVGLSCMLSVSGSDESKAEKTMFARCLFRLVICTERTAA